MSSLYGRKLSLFTGNKIHIKVNLLQSDVRKVVRNDSLLLLLLFFINSKYYSGIKYSVGVFHKSYRKQWDIN